MPKAVSPGLPEYFLAQGERALTWLAALAALVIVFNAAVYSATVGMSTLISDSWYFVESFLMKYYERGLNLEMLLSKRSAVDHAGPIQKLILLADARLFGLDFRMEGLFGVFASVVGLAVAAHWMQRLKWGSGANLWPAVGLASLAAVYLSMNVPVIFDWPLVSLYFVIMLIVFAFFASVAHTMESGRYWLAALASFVCMLCVDDIGILAWISVATIIGLAAFRREVSVRRAVGTVVAIGVGLALSRIVYALYTEPFDAVDQLSAWQRLSSVLALGWAGLAKAAVIILSAPVIHRSQIAGSTDALQGTQIVLALLVGALHVWFWVSQWTSKPTFLGRFAAAVMLFAYLLAAGILYGRVTEFGLDYLNAPRYVQFYGLALVAIILQLQVAIAGSERVWCWPKAILSGMAVLLVGLQFGYVKAAWERAPYVARMERELAFQMRSAADPKNVEPMKCLPQMVICRKPYAQRAAVLEFLRVRQLNVFSPRVQALRRLDAPDRSGARQ